METYRLIPLGTYPRRAHFAYFSQMAQPYAGLTVPVEITAFLKKLRQEGSPFFLSFLYCVCRAANRVPDPLALEDGTYCYCVQDGRGPFGGYLSRARRQQEAARVRRSLEDGEDSLSLLFLSTLPWVSYGAIGQPTPFPADSNPRITWGRWRQEGERVVLPVSLLCHHALVDGRHMAAFYQYLEEELAAFPHNKP